MRRLAFYAAIAIGMSISANSHATVLFQSLPDLTVNPATNAWCSSCSGRYQVFDTFTIGSKSNISEIDFAVETNYAFPTKVTIGIYSLSNGLPDTQLFNEDFDPSSFTYKNTSHNTSIVSALPANLSLAAGSYDITFYNPTNLAIPGYTNPGGVLYQSGVGFHSNQSAAFDLIGNTAIPEPASFGIVIAGLAGFGWTRRKLLH